jgi:hypothetical protein
MSCRFVDSILPRANHGASNSRGRRGNRARVALGEFRRCGGGSDRSFYSAINKRQLWGHMATEGDDQSIILTDTLKKLRKSIDKSRGDSDGGTRHWNVIWSSAAVFVVVMGGVIAFFSQMGGITSDMKTMQESLSFLRTQSAEDESRINDLRELVQAIKTASDLNSQAISHINSQIDIVQQQTAASTRADAISVTDRDETRLRVTKLEDNLPTVAASLQAETASIKNSLLEVETQFCSADQTRNLMIEHMTFDVGVLWQEHFKNPLPAGNTYYPTICRRDGSDDPPPPKTSGVAR